MKSIKIILQIVLSVVFSFQYFYSTAQALQKVSYQMVVRDASSALVKGSTVGVQISIL